MFKKQNKKGMSLIEIMIVVAIVGILMVVVIPNYRRIQEQSNVAKAKSELRSLQTAVENYYVHNGSYPAALNDVTSATPNIVSSIPDDVFASSGTYGYDRGGTGDYYYVLYSVGPDGTGSASIGSDVVTETDGSSCIYVSNAGTDTTP